MATPAVDKIRGFLERWLHAQEGPRDADLPREPSMDALMKVCCGPRLLSKALTLHGEDLSDDSSRDHPAGGSKPPG
jgi:hypothetical protein